MYDRYFDYEFDEALPTCEEEYGDRFDDYAEDEEPKNREPWEDDDWEPMGVDEYMHMKL